MWWVIKNYEYGIHIQPHRNKYVLYCPLRSDCWRGWLLHMHNSLRQWHIPCLSHTLRLLCVLRWQMRSISQQECESTSTHEIHQVLNVMLMSECSSDETSIPSCIHFSSSTRLCSLQHIDQRGWMCYWKKCTSIAVVFAKSHPAHVVLCHMHFACMFNVPYACMHMIWTSNNCSAMVGHGKVVRGEMNVCLQWLADMHRKCPRGTSDANSK